MASPSPQSPGYIYIIQELKLSEYDGTPTGYYKVGHSYNVEETKKKLQAGNPQQKLILLSQPIEADKSAKSFVHTRLQLVEPGDTLSLVMQQNLGKRGTGWYYKPTGYAWETIKTEVHEAIQLYNESGKRKLDYNIIN